MDYQFLTKTTLFRGITPEEARKMMHCLDGEERSFSRGETVCRAGDAVAQMGLVLSGSVNVEHDDLWGNKSIINHVSSGQIFAEAYACVPGELLVVNVVAAEACEILFLNVGRILQICSGACGFHTKLVRNLLSVMAQRNLELSQRILHTSPKTIRGRLISYLSYQAAKSGTSQVTVPFNRQQLADYLGVDRSALSNELGKMQRDGILEVNRSTFRLLGI